MGTPVGGGGGVGTPAGDTRAVAVGSATDADVTGPQAVASSEIRNKTDRLDHWKDRFLIATIVAITNTIPMPPNTITKAG